MRNLFYGINLTKSPSLLCYVKFDQQQHVYMRGETNLRDFINCELFKLF